jgi:hypothetical protein
MAITREDLMRAGIGANAPMPMPAQAAPQRQGLLGGFFGPQGADARARLAIGLEGMTLNPNQALIGQLQQGIESRETAAQKNATAAWLRSRGRDDLAAAMEAGASPQTVLAEALRPADPMAAINLEKAQLELEQLRTPKGPEFRRATPEEAAAYGAQGGQFGPDGRFYAVDVPQGMTIESDGAGGFRMVQGPGAATAKPLTEAQSKDVVFATRAQGALAVLDPVAEELTNLGSRAAEIDPTGVVRGRVQSPEYQVAKQASDEFLQAILRKDTGAAITPAEQALYGVTYLPQPGDGPAVLEAKRAARQRAVAAIEGGMSAAQIIAQEKALGASPGTAAPAAGNRIRYDSMGRRIE